MLEAVMSWGRAAARSVQVSIYHEPLSRFGYKLFAKLRTATRALHGGALAMRCERTLSINGWRMAEQNQHTQSAVRATGRTFAAPGSELPARAGVHRPCTCQGRMAWRAPMHISNIYVCIYIYTYIYIYIYIYIYMHTCQVAAL
jgi:hypothetical protein